MPEPPEEIWLAPNPGMVSPADWDQPVRGYGLDGDDGPPETLYIRGDLARLHWNENFNEAPYDAEVLLVTVILNGKPHLQLFHQTQNPWGERVWFNGKTFKTDEGMNLNASLHSWTLVRPNGAGRT